MARAMWKGTLLFGKEAVPVKLYAAAQPRGVQFRLLHEPDGVPVKQRMVNPNSGEPVPVKEVRRAYATEDGAYVLLREEELEALEPESSREIEIRSFVARSTIADYWYDRPYYLSPDGDPGAYYALVDALEQTKRSGIAHWVMRRKQYAGAVEASDGQLRLVTLRHAEEIVPIQELRRPGGRTPEPKELDLAVQLVDALAGPFEPEAYADEYRHRVEQLIERKAQGEHIELPRPRRRRAPERELSDALRDSLKRAKEASVA